MSDTGVLCQRHGQTQERFLCQHLTPESRGLSFLTGPDGDNADCADCARVWDAEGDWTDVVDEQLSVKLVCERCFEEILANNVPWNV